MDPNFDKVCNFMLENSGAEIRVTVWESDLKKSQEHRYKNITSYLKTYTQGKLIISPLTCFK